MTGRGLLFVRPVFMRHTPILALAAALICAQATPSHAAAAPAARSPAPVAAAPAMAPGPIIRRIDVVGTQRIEPDTVTSYLTLVQGQPYDAEKADTSLKALFATGLFADARIDWDGSVVSVSIVENPIINQVAFEGNSKLTTENLTKEVQIKPRNVFTRSKVQADVQRIIELYRRSGRFGATVEPKIIQRPQNRVDLVFEIHEGQSTGVARISFIGNKVFGSSDLQGQIATQESVWWKFLSTSDNYDPDRLTFDREQIRRYYLNHGYADVRVVSAVAELAPDRSAFFITFTIDEGEHYKFGKIAIDSQIKDLDQNRLMPLLQSVESLDYDADAVNKSVESLTLAAGSLGYAFTDIRPRIDRDREHRTIGVTYRIDPGPRVYIERINIVGNTRTRDNVIRREMRLSEGDAFNRVLQDRSRTRIRSLGFFKDVTIADEPGTTSDRTVVNVTVTEQPTGELSLGAGYSSADSFLAQFSYTERNLFGRGQFLRAAISFSSLQQQIDFRFTDPYFLNRPLAAGLELYKLTTDFTNYSGYTSDTEQFSDFLAFPLSEYGRMTLRYSLSNEKLSADANSATEIKLAAGSFLTSAIGYSYSYDLRDDTIKPTNGWDLTFGQDLAGIGGNLKYIRTEGSAEIYTPLPFQMVGSARISSGYIMAYGGQDVRINDRFFKGGDSFRGFRIAGIGPRDIAAVGKPALGGNLYAVGTLQARLPPMLPESYGIDLSLFSDFGTLGIVSKREKNLAGTNIVDDLAPRVSAGIAIGWKSPFGPVEVDVGYPFVKQDYDKIEAIRFSAGTRF